MTNFSGEKTNSIVPGSADEVKIALIFSSRLMEIDDLLEIKELVDIAINSRQPNNRQYSERLKEIIEISNSMPGCSGQRALNCIIMDLEGYGPIGELLHTLDYALFLKVMEMLHEFRVTGIRENFNDLHYDARRAIQRDENLFR